jgi:hypothetical protein
VVNVRRVERLGRTGGHEDLYGVVAVADGFSDRAIVRHDGLLHFCQVLGHATILDFAWRTA